MIETYVPYLTYILLGLGWWSFLLGANMTLYSCIPPLLMMGSIHQCIPFSANQFCGTNLYTYTVEDIYWLSCWFRRVIWMKHHKTCQFWCSAERAPFWLHDTTTNWTNKAISLRQAADRWCFYRYCGVWAVMTIVVSHSHGRSKIVPMRNFERYGSSEARAIVATVLVVRCRQLKW